MLFWKNNLFTFLSGKMCPIIEDLQLLTLVDFENNCFMEYLFDLIDRTFH